MSIETLVTVAFVATFFGYALLERVLPGYDYPSRPLWVLRGIGWLALTFAVATVVPLATDAWLADHALFDMSSAGLWAVVPAVLLYQLLGYAWHRSMHEVPALWRIHQMHHASERVDIWSAQRFHPIDMAMWSVIASVSAVGVLGVSVEAALATSYLSAAFAWFGHTNVKTPRWLGYLVARPESHALHHARGVHRKNYADLPVVDLLFGTFDNPESAPAAAGFWDGASERTGALLLGLDVDRPAADDSPMITARAA